MTPTFCFTNEFHKGRSRNSETVNHEARPYRIYFGNSGASVTFQFLFSVSLVFVIVTSVNLLKQGPCVSFGGWQNWGEGVELSFHSQPGCIFTQEKGWCLGRREKVNQGRRRNQLKGNRLRPRRTAWDWEVETHMCFPFGENKNGKFWKFFFFKLSLIFITMWVI